MLLAAQPMPVLHLLDAMGGGQHLWGKERVVLSLAEAQRASSVIEPRIATFAPSLLTTEAQARGLRVDRVGDKTARFSRHWAPALRQLLSERPGTVLHTHGYKANLLGRLPDVRGAAAAVVATCHGWVDTSPQLKLYNWLDRTTAARSDMVTVPDPAMKDRFNGGAEVVFVPNGVAERPVPTPQQQAAARAMFGWPKERLVAGMLGRMSLEKGVHEFVEAASRCQIPQVLWVAAGAGPLASVVAGHDNLQYVGYVDADDFLAAIDVFVQPSRTEALSLALLEAARAAKPIVATKVGATEFAVRHRQEALLTGVDATEICNAVDEFHGDLEWARRLGQAARRRFEEALGLNAVHESFLSVYRRALAKRAAPTP